MTSSHEQNQDLALWQGVVARLSRLRDAAAALNRPATFDVITARSSDEKVAVVSTSPTTASRGAGAHAKPSTGEHTLVVEQVAQAQKLITGTFPEGAAALGLSGTCRIDGRVVHIVAQDSLNDVAVKFARSGANVRTQIVHLGPSDFRLILTANATGVDSGMTLDDIDGSPCENLGLHSTKAQLVAPRDAKFTLDDAGHTSPENTIPGLIPGVTISLQTPEGSEKANTATISIGIAPSKAVDAVAEFVAAFNEASTSFAALEFDPSSNLAGIIASVEQAVASGSGSMRLSEIGLTFANGMLSMDPDGLARALSTDADAVFRFFGLDAVCESPTVAFVAASAKTRELPADGFRVKVTEPASMSRVTASTAQTAASVDEEHLTFSGPLFAVNVKLTVPAGSTLEDTARRINRSARLRGKVIAGIEDGAGKLVLTSRYGASGVFAVTSDMEASTETSGIGTSPTIVDGRDVAGTIHGEPAVGDGRTLTGCLGNEHTEALQIIVSAETADECGRVFLGRGIADRVYHAVGAVLEPGQASGVRSGDLTAQIDDTEQQIARMNDQLGAFEEYLEQTLSAMDLRVNHLREQAEELRLRSYRHPTSRTF